MNFPQISSRICRRAFTLMEMVMSCLILSLLMTALGYGLKLALASTGNGAAQAIGSLEAAEIVERVTDDLNEAATFTAKGTRAVAFKVPDRDGDNSEEEIRYEWWPTGGTHTVNNGGNVVTDLVGGLLGALTGGGGGSSTSYTIPANTLTRQLNNGVPAVLSRDVRAFDLNYLYRSMSPPVSTAAAEEILYQNDPLPLLGAQKDFDVDYNKWIAFSFLPSAFLPAGTTSWSLTKVSLHIKSDGACESVFRVSVRAVNGANNAPNTVIYESVSMPEVGLNDTYRWIDIPFATTKGLSPTTKYAVVIEGITGGGKFCQVNHVQSVLGIPAIPSGTWMSQSINRGTAWLFPTTNALRFRIYGTKTS